MYFQGLVIIQFDDDSVRFYGSVPLTVKLQVYWDTWKVELSKNISNWRVKNVIKLSKIKTKIVDQTKMEFSMRTQKSPPKS